MWFGCVCQWSGSTGSSLVLWSVVLVRGLVWLVSDLVLWYVGAGQWSGYIGHGLVILVSGLVVLVSDLVVLVSGLVLWSVVLVRGLVVWWYWSVV